jgi:hypothetical protein
MAEDENRNSSEEGQEEEEGGIHFLDVAMIFFNQGVLALGMVPHPVTGEVYVSFEAAQESIAILEVLREKSQGNLDEEESQAMTQMVDELKMAFVRAIRDPRAREVAEKTRQRASQGGGAAAPESKIITPDGRPATAAQEGPKIILPGM